MSKPEEKLEALTAFANEALDGYFEVKADTMMQLYRDVSALKEDRDSWRRVAERLQDELFDAKALLPILKKATSSVDPLQCNPWLGEALAAIEKAEGRQP